MGFEKFFGWAFGTGKEILKVNNGEKLLKRLIFDIRAEETPGRFLEKLSERITEYRTNTNIQAKVDIDQELFGIEFKKEGDKWIRKEKSCFKWHGDSFYYMKSAVLSGFLDALAFFSRKQKVEEKRGEENE